MKQLTRIMCAALVCVMAWGQTVAPAWAQKRSARTTAAPARPTPQRTTQRTPAKRTPVKPTTPPAPRVTAADARLTGVYQLLPARSDDPQEAAAQATAALPPDEQQRIIDSLVARLTSPPQLTLQRRGRVIDIASTRAPRITFEADGITRTERAADGHTVQTRAALEGDSLSISSRGGADDQFAVAFDPLDAGQRLRVTRRIYDPQLRVPVTVQSLYEKTASIARFDIYGRPEPATTSARNQRRSVPTPPPAVARTRPPTTPPVMRPRPADTRPPVPVNTGFVIGRNMQFVAVLDNDLTTERTQVGERFTMTVREPAQFAGATLEGTVARVERAGPFGGRAELLLNFERIRLTDGREAAFAGVVEAARPPNGDDARVDPEGSGEVQERDSQTDRTVERAAIGAAVGAIIGAIAKGGRGAAIGAAIGAGAGAGSVYVQGRDDLDLPRGTEIILRANPNG